MRKEKRLKQSLKRNHAVALWMYAPGLINPDAEQKINPKHMEDITGIRMGMRNEKYLAGFKLCDRNHPISERLEEGHIYGRIDWPLHYNQSAYQEHTTQSYLYPLIYADDPEAKVLGRFCGPKLPALAVKECEGYTSVFCGSKIIQSDILREVARFAGCHIYSEENDVLYANRNFITIHAAKSGIKKIQLREKCYPYELYEERFYEAGDVIELKLKEGETKMFALLTEMKKPIVR